AIAPQVAGGGGEPSNAPGLRSIFSILPMRYTIAPPIDEAAGLDSAAATATRGGGDSDDDAETAPPPQFSVRSAVAPAVESVEGWSEALTPEFAPIEVGNARKTANGTARNDTEYVLLERIGRGGQGEVW